MSACVRDDACARRDAGSDGKPGERRVIMMGGGGPMHGPGGGMRMHHRMDPAKHADHLRTVLQLRPDQEGALKAFIEATKPQMRTERREAPAADAPAPKPLTTPERLDRQARRMADHQAAFQKRAAAVRAFYAQLTPSQQKAFDALHMAMGGRHGRDVRVIRRHGPGGPGGADSPHGPGSPMVWEGEGGGTFIIDGSDGQQEIEIELGDGPDEPEA